MGVELVLLHDRRIVPNRHRHSSDGAMEQQTTFLSVLTKSVIGSFPEVAEADISFESDRRVLEVSEAADSEAGDQPEECEMESDSDSGSSDMEVLSRSAPKRIKKPCSVEGCSTMAHVRGLCSKHGGYTGCLEDGSSKHAVSGGLCAAHMKSLIRN